MMKLYKYSIIKNKNSIYKHFDTIDKWEYFYDNGLIASQNIRNKLYSINCYLLEDSFDDYFGPVNKDCIKIDKNKTKVFFIDDLIQLDKILNQYFINSQYVGIDSEWQQNFKVIDKTEVSIIQIANYDENCCAILDMLEFSKEDKIDKF